MEGVSGPEGFDAELYLRLAGERALLAGEGPGPWTSPLLAAAHALVAIGALPAGTARAVLADYRLAQAYRQAEPVQTVTAVSPPTSPEVIRGGMRAVPCGQVIDQPWGELRIEFIVFGTEATALHVRMRLKPRPPIHWPNRAIALEWFSPHPPSAAYGFPQTLTLADDHGTVTDARFDRDGRVTQWTGQYVTSHPLARDAAWLEVLGERIWLAGQAAVPARIRTELLTEPDPARRYLWAVLASAFDDDEAAQAMVAALKAAGALAADDPEVSAVCTMLTWPYPRPNGPSGWGSLPELWRSLRLPGQDGPAGLVVLGAVTPEFDGIRVAVLALESTAEEFSIAVETAPDASSYLGEVDDPVLAWWAVDDLGHCYLGESGDWGWDTERGGGRIEFSAPLDPDATMLDLVPTTPAARAIITIPLNWAG
jgi:hypothetical protein